MGSFTTKECHEDGFQALGERQIPLIKCSDGETINYNVPIIKQVSVKNYNTKCEAAAYAQCSTREEIECVEVEYEECKDIVEPVCFGSGSSGMEFKIPFQN